MAGLGSSESSCWTHGFTRGQCCNAIFGSRGYPMCWDAGDFTFERCCGGKVFEARGCGGFVTHFGFGAVGYTGGDASPAVIGKAWSDCASGMEERPGQCNSANTTARTCPECALLSRHLTTYIRCVKEEQRRSMPSGSRPASVPGDDEDDGGVASHTIVGGHHFPTLLRPRSEGRDFTLLASAYDMTVGTQLIHEGNWMPQELRLLEGFLPYGGVAVDAGANIGGFALPLSKHVGPDGQVHAFEPFRNIFQILTANCAMNGLTSCYTYHNALGEKPERKVRPSPGLNAVGNPSKSFVVDEVASEMLVHHDGQGRTETIEVTRLDDKLDLPRLDIIKIDVESAEYEMLLGAGKTISRHRPLIYVEDSEAELESMRQPTRVMRLLSERHGYECLNLVQSGLTSMTSLLCVPSERTVAVRERLHTIDWNLT